eukprot:gene12177-5667_t
MTIIQTPPKAKEEPVQNENSTPEYLIKENEQLQERIEEQEKEVDFFAKLTMILLTIFIVIIFVSFILPAFNSTSENQKNTTLTPEEDTKEDYHDILNTTPITNQKGIMKAYESIWSLYSPERTRHLEKGADLKFQKVLKAFYVLQDPKRRQIYEEKKGCRSSDFMYSSFNTSPDLSIVYNFFLIIVLIFIVHLINRFFNQIY